MTKEETKCTCKEHDPYCCQIHGTCPTCVKKECTCENPTDNTCDYCEKENKIKILEEAKEIALKGEPKTPECYFIPSNNTSSATICKNCGGEKFLHSIGQGIGVSKSVIITQEEPKQELLGTNMTSFEIELDKMYTEEDMIKFAEFVASYPDKNRNYLNQMLHAKSKYDGSERTIDLFGIWLKKFKKKQ
jgi:hypothetical protein